MRIAGLVLVLLAAGAGPSLAADPAERRSDRRSDERARVSAAAGRHYGPQVRLHGAAEQVVVTRGPRLLLEDDSVGLLEPVYTVRRLPSSVSRALVEAEFPHYENPPAREPGVRRRAARR